MDKYDIPFLIKDINDEMPLFSKDTVKVKRSYSQGMPKNLKEYGDKVNEKFLDNSLATIEDYSLKFPNNELTQWFKDYQNRYFNSVLLKDSFLKIDENGNFGTTRYYRGMSIQNVAFLASKISGGADLSSFFTTDILGNTRTVPWDIGAYEYQSSGTTNVIHATSVRFNLLIN